MYLQVYFTKLYKRHKISAPMESLVHAPFITLFGQLLKQKYVLNITNLLQITLQL